MKHQTDLNGIHSPADIRRMSIDELTVLAAEMRSALLEKLSAHGGHVGPNLGFLEATIALHYVFNTPEDLIVFDVSHQTYPHKMLTGRMQAFTNPAHYDDVTGYTNPKENPTYDLFALGHTSTSLAMAAGLAKARDLEGGKQNVVAVIGDGSLGGGEAFEGLNYGATLGTNFIVVVNDNDMSIAENHGGIYADLRLLRNTNGEGEPNLFRSFGYGYEYVRYGNDLRSLIRAFSAVKDTDHPVVVHINTMKGNGLPVAEAHKEAFHYSAPFDLKTGAVAGGEGEDYTEIFSNHMLQKMHVDPKVTVITAGTPGAYDFTPEKRREAGRQFIDVGIAEQCAAGLCSGLAKNGAKPVFGVMATFLQRAYDQMAQDISINRQPVLTVDFAGSVYGISDETHLGFFDIPLISNIPGIIFLAPACKEEYLAMIDWALEQRESPVFVRTPGGPVVSDPTHAIPGSFAEPKYEVYRQGGKTAFIGAGPLFYTALKAADILKEKGIEATVINPRVLSALDTETLDSLKEYETVVTLEDGSVDGGFGQKVAGYLAKYPVRVIVRGLPKEFLDRYDATAVVSECGLTPEAVAALAE